ncbi:DUF7344 domain-containing protein [Halalkalicoccus tibetensis]|uniref:DUF7344 domain-containing protein n=1 Tax=Halalkalicoccus tibetensis TaxID=175632 RepID=A0ABD5VCC9_9EURY
MYHSTLLEESDGSSAALSKDDLFGLLSDHRRRSVLRYLATHSGSEPVGIGTLVDRVSAEGASTGSADDADDRIRIQLHHNHLPKLEDHDVIEYDPARERVTSTRDLTPLLPYLE